MATFNAPVVPAFLAGAGLQASDFSTLWYQVASFYQNRVVFRISQSSAATSLPAAGTFTTIAYDTVLEDPYSGWAAVTANTWTPPAGYSGWFEVTATLRTVTLANNVDVNMQVVSGGVPSGQFVNIMGSSNAGAGCCGSLTVYLIGGQDGILIQGRVLNSGVAVNTSLTAGQQSTLEIVWVSQS